MLRIGIAASKMAKDNLLTYNLFVILISFLFSVIIFLIGGFLILLIVLLTSVILHALRPADFHAGWLHMFKICLAVLAFVVGIFNIVAVIKNIQLTKNKI
jgi:hypothetical protein